MEITPLGFGGAIGEWFRLIGRNWRPLLFSSLAVHVPLAVVVAGVFWWSGAATGLSLIMDPDLAENLSDDEVIRIALDFVWPIAVWFIGQTLATLFVYLAGGRIVAGDLAGQRPGSGEAARFGMRRLPHAIAVVLMLMIFSLAVIAIPVVLGILLIGDLGSGFWTVLVTAIAALTAFVFLVWIGIALALAFQVIAMEPRGPVSALRRSFDLVKTTWWPTFGFLIVSAIIATAGAQVLSFALLPLAIASVFAAEVIVVYYSAIVLIQGVVAPAIAAAQAIWYVELRASQESLTAAELVW